MNENRNENEITKWFVDNTDKWTQEEDTIIFHVPINDIPPEAVEVARAYKECCDNSKRKAQLLHSMGIGVADDWE